MAKGYDSTVSLAAPPHTRARYGVLGVGLRFRQAATFAVVALVPGAWAVWLAWYYVRHKRSAA